MRAKHPRQCRVRFLVPARADPRHHVTALGIGEHVRHRIILTTDLSAEAMPRRWMDTLARAKRVRAGCTRIQWPRENAEFPPSPPRTRVGVRSRKHLQPQ